MNLRAVSTARKYLGRVASREIMLETFRRHWPHYLAEAAGLAFFMASASLVTTLLRSPLSPFAHAIKEPFLQLVALGVPMGFVIIAIIYSPWGKKSGAHINPAVTLALWRMGKISAIDAGFYILFQFAGGAVTVQLMGLVLGAAYRHPSINYVATVPGPSGPLKAFVAEGVITFILMLVLLLAINSKKAEKWAGAIAGALICLYLMFEEPYSGMSLNPARTFASALAAREWTGLWIYFAAPVLATLAAAEVFQLITRGRNRIPRVPMCETKCGIEHKPPQEATAS